MARVNDSIKNFIQEHADQINDFNKHQELVQDAVDELEDDDLKTLFSMLEEIGIYLNDYRWEVFDYLFSYYLSNMRGSTDDPSNAWSRLDYILDYTQSQGFTHQEIVDHLKKVKDILGIKMDPLPPEYGWDGAGDYDLGSFDKEMYRDMYPEEFED